MSSRCACLCQHTVHGGPRNPVPLHAAPSTAATTPALTRPRSGLPHSRGGRPDKIKEELRLCLDFLDDPAEGPDSEEEEEVSGQAVGQNLSVVPDEEYLDSSSCSSSYDSPPAEYTETDDFAEDEASYAQGVSAYFSEDSFSQAHVPDFGSAWDRDRAASMPDISGRETGPFMTKLLQYAMVHPVSPPPRVARSPSVGSPASGSSPASAVSTASSIYSPSPPPATALTPPAPSPPPPPPPPPPEGKSLWLQHQPVPKPFAPPQLLSTSLAPSTFTTGGSTYRVLDKKRGGGSGNSTAPTVGKKEEVDLHALLCQEILQLGLGRSGNESLPGSKMYAGSPLIGKGGVFVEHLIRPSSIKSGRNTRDWGSGDSKNSIKRLGASEPIISSFEFQEVPPKKTTIFKSELNVIPKRKIAPVESPGGCSLLSFWQKKEESSSKENLPSPSSWPTKPRPFGASKSAGELKTMLPSTSVTQKKEALISAFQNVTAKKTEPQVAETKTMKGSAEQRPGVWNSVSKPSTHPVPLAHEGETVTVEDKPKVPPPTLPKSSSMKSLQLPRSFLPQKPPAVFTPARNSGSRLSSSSSVDSDVFTTNTGPPNSEPRRLSTHEAEQNSSADSSREVGRRFPFMDPARLGGGSSLQERFPTLDLDRTDGDSSQDPEPSPSRTLAQNLALLRKDSLVAGLQDKVGLSQPQWSNKAQETVPVPASQDSNMNRVTQVSEKDAAHEMASSMSPSGSDSDAPKKRAAPRPRFDARRLTQEAKVVWKCSEESKTDYRPEMLSTTVNSKPNPEKTPKVHEVSKANPAKEHPSFMEKNVPETHKSEYKSWAADFLKDRILISESTEKHSARGIPPTQETIHEPKATPTSNGDSTSYHAETLFLPPKKPPPVHTKPMSISERISLLSKVQSPKSSTSSMSDLKPGSISDRDGPDDTSRIKPKTQVPTKEQKFASLLQNRLSNIIAEDEESSRREREREKAKRAQSRKITPAEEIARSRSLDRDRSRVGGSGLKPIKTDLPAWSPELTSTPGPAPRTTTDLHHIHSSVKDMAKEFDHLSDSLSAKEDEDKRQGRVRRRRSRRLSSTGMSVLEMKHMFDNPDSLPSSSGSTRNNSPKPVSAIYDKVLERFGAPAIAENRPVVDKGMVPLSLTGSRSSVLDLVKKVETGAQDIRVPAPRRPSEKGFGVQPIASLMPSSVREGEADSRAREGKRSRMDKSRRYTTGVNFAELQLRFSQPDNFKKPNQSRSMSTIFASAQDISRQYDGSATATTNPTSSSARSMENLTHSSLLRSRLEKSTETLTDMSRDSVFERCLSRSESYGVLADRSVATPPDIQSANGSAFSRVSAVHSPIKVSDPSVSTSPATSLNRSPVGDLTSGPSASESARRTVSVVG